MSKTNPFVKFRMARPSSLSEDLEALKKYYSDNETEFVKDRGEVLKDVVKDEKMVMGFDENSKLVAVTGEFEHNSGHHREIGGVLSILPGFGLQTIMMSILVVKNLLLDPPEGEIFAVTEDINIGSQKGIGRAGFALVDNLNSLEIWTSDFQSDNSVKRYYIHQKEKLNINIQLLQDILNNGGVEKNGQYLNVEFNIPFIKMGFM